MKYHRVHVKQKKNSGFSFIYWIIANLISIQVTLRQNSYVNAREQNERGGSAFKLTLIGSNSSDSTPEIQAVATSEKQEEEEKQQQQQQQQQNDTIAKYTIVVPSTILEESPIVISMGQHPMCPIVCDDASEILIEGQVVHLPTTDVPCDEILVAAQSGYLSTKNCNFLFELIVQQNSCQCMEIERSSTIPPSTVPSNFTTISPTINGSNDNDEDDDDDDGIRVKTDDDEENDINNGLSDDDGGVRIVVSTSPSLSNVPNSSPTPTLQVFPYPVCHMCGWDDSWDTNIIIGTILLPDKRTLIPCQVAHEAASIGLLSTTNCNLLHAILQEQHVCGCLSRSTSTTNDNHDSGGGSNLPFSFLNKNRTSIQSSSPSDEVTDQPSTYPSKTPSDVPSSIPSLIPSGIPTKSPIEPTVNRTTDSGRPLASTTSGGKDRFSWLSTYFNMSG
jgi:hypothetical protein